MSSSTVSKADAPFSLTVHSSPGGRGRGRGREGGEGGREGERKGEIEGEREGGREGERKGEIEGEREGREGKYSFLQTAVEPLSLYEDTPELRTPL